jgi:hypothetical protein
MFGRAPSSSRFNKTAPPQFFSAKHPSSKNSRSTKYMDLAPNSAKSMECLKGYSAKPCFVLTRGVEWKLPTTATHYTSVLVRFYFPPGDPSPPLYSPRMTLLLLPCVNSAAAATLPSAGRAATPDLAGACPIAPPPLPAYWTATPHPTGWRCLHRITAPPPN